MCVDTTESFEELVRRHQAAVCGIAYSQLRDRSLSEEVAQEAFLLAWLRRAETPPTAAWVCGIARNLARNAARHPRENAMSSETASQLRDARDQLIDRETQEQALAALAKLPERFRDAVVLYYRGDETMTAVASALGISEEAARQRVHRGREKLRTAMEAVERALRGTRPGVAFTAAAVAAWSARSREAAAATGAAATLHGGASARGIAWLVGVGAVAGSVALVASGAPGPARDAAPASRPEPMQNGSAPASVARGPAFAPASVRLPHSPSLHLASSASSAAPPASAAPSSPTVDLDSTGIPLGRLGLMLGTRLHVPISIDRALATTPVDIHGNGLEPLDALDEVLEQAHATRRHGDVLRLQNVPGRTDARALGGDLVTLQLVNVLYWEALDAIGDKLHLPIVTRLTTEDDALMPPQPPTVTIDVDDVPAGVALQQLLDQTHWSFEITTGIVVTPES